MPGHRPEIRCCGTGEGFGGSVMVDPGHTAELSFSDESQSHCHPVIELNSDIPEEVFGELYYQYA